MPVGQDAADIAALSGLTLLGAVATVVGPRCHLAATHRPAGEDFNFTPRGELPDEFLFRPLRHEPFADDVAVIGDEAVHAKFGDAFWQQLADAMSSYFCKSEFTPGLIHGVQKASELLAEHFPRHHR